MELHLEGTAEGVAPAVIRRVLYVDDNASNVKLVRAIFASRSDIELFTAVDARQAFECAQSEDLDLVLLDLNLPDEPGDAVLVRLREDPRTEHVPKVIVSAEDVGRVARRADAAGADAYVTKPFDLDVFLEVVDRMLGSA